MFGSLFTLVVRTITTAALVTAVILDAVAHPNLRSWSCISKEFEHDFRDNEIGFEHVCFDLVGSQPCFPRNRASCTAKHCD